MAKSNFLRALTLTNRFVPLAILVACASNRAEFDQDVSRSDGDADASFVDKTFGDAGQKGSLNDRDPVTCDEAKDARSYVGCDYWPTVLPNIVQDVFDFAVAVANTGDQEAEVTVTGPGSVDRKVTVAAGALETIYLPWVDALKGEENRPPTSSVVEGGAYHLVSSRPVVVYQFNALEFKAEGGPPGKDWSSCEIRPLAPDNGCFSYTNDASLLLPSTAMTGTYRIMAMSGQLSTGSHVAITATTDGTNVTVRVGAKSKVRSSGGVLGGAAGATFMLSLNRGDVALVVTDEGLEYDPTGSLVTADQPIQVISGTQCATIPWAVPACDHLEETVFPAETLGKHYVVTRPTGPHHAAVPHVVRFVGNVDGTKLTFRPSKPDGCPSELAAGEAADCGAPVADDFEVVGDHEFGVGTFLLGAEIVDPNAEPGREVGDPSQSSAVTVEQYRRRYVFLAPPDYTSSYVDVVGHANTQLTLDGIEMSQSFTPIDGTEWSVGRIELTNGAHGVHVLEASAPVGVQVLGYGQYTSYQYPGGLNLAQIAPPPVK